MKDKIIESIFFQFTFNLLQMTQSQKLITHKILHFMKKLTNGYEGMCMSGGKFLME